MKYNKITADYVIGLMRFIKKERCVTNEGLGIILDRSRVTINAWINKGMPENQIQTTYDILERYYESDIFNYDTSKDRESKNNLKMLKDEIYELRELYYELKISKLDK